ncbi:MAG: hypothetical protein AAF329_08270 [Cyanobacteria bacterium P01_A01_bin.17]
MTQRRFRANYQTLSKLLTGAALSFSLVTGCVMPIDPGDPGARTLPDVPLPPDAVINKVLAVAAQDLGLPQSTLSWLRVNDETWTDGCLGVGSTDESCLQALVDGWQVEVVYNNQSWFYRTDTTGDTVRQSYLENNLPPSLGELVLNSAANDLGIAKERLEIVRAEPQDWQNGCLELEQPWEACTEVLVFGWQVTVISDDQLVVYHTDMTGYQIRSDAYISDDVYGNDDAYRDNTAP